jgi:DNA polymerase I
MSSSAPLAAKPVLTLIDGSGFIFRAYHALPPLTRADGTPVGAVLGFCNMLVRLRETHQGSQIAVIFDAARKTFRNDIYPDYKAHRPPAPDDLVPQFALVREAAEAFGLPAIESLGYEADDLIASYARAGVEAGMEVVIVSSDKDLMQLIRPGVSLWDAMKNKAIGDAEVFEKFGVPPDKVVDVQSLAGDSTDNVPGVPGIGVKTAAQLITDFGDLDSLLARAGEIPQPKRRQSLIDFADQARISRRLVQLDAAAPLPLPLDSLTETPPDPHRLSSFLDTQGFRSLSARLSGKPKESNPAPISLPHEGNTAPRPAAPAVAAQYELIQTLDRLQAWAAQAKAAGVVAFDTETDSLRPSTTKLVGVSLATAAGLACYIPLNHEDPNSAPAEEGSFSFATSPRPKQIALRDAIPVLKDLLEDPATLKVGHNIKFDMQVIAQHGITLSPFDDTMLMSFTLDAGRHGHGMDELAERHLGHTAISYDSVTGTGKKRVTFDRVPLDIALTYAAEDADITLRLWQLLKPRLAAENVRTVYERFERPLAPVLAAMETAGVSIDKNVLAGLSQDFERRMGELEQEIHRLAGQPFNVGSPKQLGDILFGALGLPGGTKGKTGAYATGVEVLEPLADQGHEIAEKVLEWRGVAKLKSTYSDALPEQIAPTTGRVHTSYSMVGAATGRLSSTDPNLQNIPIRTTDGKAIRKAFIAPDGFSLLSVDYSQIELRLIADMANIKSLIQAYQDGVDIHALTASQVLGVPLENVTPDMRRNAKAINFGIIYGISGFGLAKQIGTSAGEANAFIKTYFDRFPELRTFMEDTKAFARQHGYTLTKYGRKCWISGIADKNGARRAGAERQAINAPVQGTAADILKKAMIQMPAALQTARLSARMLLQVHDELLFEVPNTELEATQHTVQSVMETAVTLSVPLKTEAGIAQNWAAAH